MTDREFLIWIHQRLIKVYGENYLADYMHRLREVIHTIPRNQELTITGNSGSVMREIEQMEEERARYG
jgi:hypothetical protein